MIKRPMSILPSSVTNLLITIIIILVPAIFLSIILIFYSSLENTLLITILFIGMVLGQFIVLYFSKSIVMRLLRATKIDHGWIYEHVKNIAKTANIPTPELYIIPDPRPNAFAIGILKSNSAIGINSGLIDILDERELRGVIAHEIAHIKNRDTLLLTTASILFNTLAISIDFIGRQLLFERKNALLGVGLIIFSFIFRLIFAPLIILALSRTREYIADETGARLISDPLSLANALEKIESFYSKQIDSKYYTDKRISNSLNMMYIQPIQNRDFLFELFSTHPPTQKRIERLKQLAREMGIY